MNTTTHEGKIAWQRNRRRMEAYGKWVDPFVDSSASVAHILALRDSYGLSFETINHLGGFSACYVEQLMFPAHNRYRTQVRRETEQAILAIRFDLDKVPANRRIPAVGTQRRLRALARLGYGQRDLADRLGIHQSSLSSYFTRTSTTASVARSVRDLYDGLWASPGPSRRAAREAERNGWAPPLAWDDDSIDDPAAVPDLGEASHIPNGGGGRPGAHLVEDVEFLLDADAALTTTGCADRLGLSPKSLKRALERAGRLDLRDRLTFNAQEAA